jgi:hypothetical protein
LPVRAVRSRGLLGAIALSGVALGFGLLAVSASGAPSAPSALAANSVTYNDSTGEDALAPDITSIVASNSDAGILTFRVNVPNRPQLTRDVAAVIFVDSDANASTGDPDSLGADYAIELILGEAILFRWDGTGFTARPGDPPQASLAYTWSGGVTITISAAELGNTRKLNFSVIVISGIVEDSTTGALDFTNAKRDFAPGGFAGVFPYEVKIGRPSIVVRRFATAPAKPAAGKPFSLRLRAARSDTGAAIRGGRVTCVGRVGASALRAQTARFVGSEAVCGWKIPPNAAGKTFRGSITIVFEGLRSTRTFSGRIG